MRWLPEISNMLIHRPIITSSLMVQNLKKLKIDNPYSFRISEARCAELKQTTPAKRVLFARDTS